MVPRGLEHLLLTPVAAKAREVVSLEAPVNNRKLIAEVAFCVALDRESDVIGGEDFLATTPAMSFEIVRA